MNCPSATAETTWDAPQPAPLGADVPRVLHVVRSLEVGGLERVVCDLIRERGFANGRVACLTARGEFADSLQGSGGVVYDLSASARGRLGLWRALTAVLRDFRPDIVHCHNMFAHAVGVFAAIRAGGVPTVLTKHGTYLPRGWSRNALHRGLMRRSSLVAVSREIHDKLVHWSPQLEQRLCYIPNGVALPTLTSESERRMLRASFGWGEKQWIWISVGRMVAGKRVDLMMHAFADVLSAFPTSRLVLVGDGPELAGLRTLSATLGLDDAVSFLGQRMDVAQLLSASDTFVMSSRNEGMPMALLEAIAAGLPVVATSVGEIPSLVQEGVTGHLVPAESSERLATAMKHVVADPGRAVQMGRAGREHVEASFSLAATARRYEALYQATIAKGTSWSRIV